MDSYSWWTYFTIFQFYFFFSFFMTLIFNKICIVWKMSLCKTFITLLSTHFIWNRFVYSLFNLLLFFSTMFFFSIHISVCFNLIVWVYNYKCNLNWLLAFLPLICYSVWKLSIPPPPKAFHFFLPVIHIILYGERNRNTLSKRKNECVFSLLSI